MTTLQSQLDAVSASVREQTPAAVLQTMNAASARLAVSGQLDNALRAGAVAPDFSLPDATGKMVSSKDLRAGGPVVLTFYRGAWCPYCNLELQAWQAHLSSLRSLGASLVAISPQTPDASLTAAQKNALDFPVLSDLGNQVARRFGLVFVLDEGLRPIYQAFGIDLQAHNGDASFELPVPATYLVGTGGEVVETWLDIDYRRRPEPAQVLARVRALTSGP